MNEHSHKWMKPLVSMLLLGSVAIFSGCGGSSSSTPPAELTGTFVDAAVEGLRYKTPSLAGTTNAAGEFKYTSGQTVEFFIGNLKLGQATGGALVTPIEIVAGSNGAVTPEVVRVLQLLQSLDSDKNASNGITISAAIQNAFSTTATFDTSDDTALNAAIVTATAVDPTITLVSTTDAQGHFNNMPYTDYLGNTRTAAATPGLAEYHTGTGYGNTMFDSAENKCQNCHNELYDTWKDSMHGKSWTDPIFQSKFQDFLRTHINKIDEDKTGVAGVDGITGIVYTEAKFVGAAQTCIKCHAPGAYYAGDFKATIEIVKAGATTADLQDAQTNVQSNLATSTTTYDPTQVASVVAVSHTNGNLYKATYQIGHKANMEGINCAFCHSIETPRLMKADGQDSGKYTLKDHIRVGPHGPAKAAAGSDLIFSADATDPAMNKFFRLWGPEKYADPSATPKTAGDFDVNKSKDGRYTMHNTDMNGTDGKVHFTGGPFYGPFGVTGISNENSNDETNRKAHINPHFDTNTNNHFGESGKGLCLSCHQRSAGAAVPSGEEGAGQFMELCSTQMAVTTGADTASNDTLSSPKCQKCHMERIEGKLLHRWADPKTLWTKAVNPGLTAHFDPEDPQGYGDENPVAAGWYNSHAFLGASKTGHKTSATAKIKSGFAASLAQSLSGSTLTVTTSLQNKTAHMLPGAHPMRRMLTRVIVKDGAGNVINATGTTGLSTFTDITNSVQPMAGKTLHSSALSSVPVNENGSASLSFPGKVIDLDGSAVASQKFDGTQMIIPGTDSTVTAQTVTSGLTEGNVSVSAITTSSDAGNFTRIYGHETGKKYNGTFVVRPGFDSNMVASDNRLSPNETETYTINYDITGKTGVTVTYKVYYMQKGANGKFIVDPATGFLDQAASDAKKLLVTEVFTDSATVN